MDLKINVKTEYADYGKNASSQFEMYYFLTFFVVRSSFGLIAADMCVPHVLHGP